MSLAYYKAFSMIFGFSCAWMLLGYVAQKEDLERTRAQLQTVSTIAARGDVELSSCLGWQARVASSLDHQAVVLAKFTDVCTK